VTAPSKSNPSDLTPEFGVIQFRVSGGPAHIFGEWKDIVRLELTGYYFEEWWSGKYKRVEDLPRKTLGVSFPSPSDAIATSNQIVQLMSATSFGTTVLTDDELIPRGKLVDDLLVSHVRAQFIEYGEALDTTPVMTLRLTGWWMKDILDPSVDDPQQALQTVTFFSNLLVLAAQLSAEARRLQSRPET
jgi:hypothetical protein